MSYGFGLTLNTTIDDAIELVKKTLAENGFGVMSDIDVQAALKEKIGVERSGYRILGACNPKLANMAIEAEPDIGLLLPCNVLIREEDDGNISVLFIDPEAMLSVTGRDDIKQLANEVKGILQNVSDQLANNA